jgi:biopolymer transport protein ExbB
MLNVTRMATLAVLLLASTLALASQTSQAQPHPAPAARPPLPLPGRAPAPAGPAPAPAATATRSTEVIDNPYGLEALERGDFVAKATLIILVISVHGELVHHHHQGV